MPRNGSGTYSLPTGNPVVAGTTIEASWANTTLNDVATEMTGSLSRAGSGGMTGPLRLDAGTASVPALAWSTETTTGLYRAGTNDVRLAVATSDVMRWQAAGVSVTGTLGVSGAVTLSGGTANGVLYLNGSNVATSGSALTFDGADMGVGGAVESGIKLKVFGSVKVQSAQPVFYMNSDNTNNAQITNAGATGVGNGQMAFTLGGVGEGMRLTSTGLGIGTASPTQRLEISGDIQQQNANYLRGRLAAGTSTRLFGLAGTNVLYIGGIDAAHDSTLFVRNGVTQMTIDASGNLGLGVVPSGSYKLEINGAASVFTSTTAGNYTTNQATNPFPAGQRVRVENLQTTTNTYAGIEFVPTNTSTQNQISYIGAVSTASGLAGDLVFGRRTGAATYAESMRLDASGNLGLNTATFGSSAAGVLSLGTGTAPTTGPADTVQLFSVDRSAGNTIPAVRCEGSGVTNAGITSTTVTHKIAMQVNGTIYYLLATTNAT